MKKILSALTLLFFPLAGWGASLPTPSLSSSVGIAMHKWNIGGAPDYAMMATAGIKIARSDFQWSETEPTTKGTYVWTAYDAMVNSMIQNGIRPYLILDYSNSLYETAVSPPYSPQHPGSVTAFANWTAAAVAHFNDPAIFPINPHIIWEIWNEPNNSQFWLQDPDPLLSGSAADRYTRLASATCTAIKAVDPNATVVAPATTTLPQAYLTTFLSSGILSCVDAISVHPYRTTQPESLLTDAPPADQLNYPSLRALINLYTPAGRGPISILSGEWGYSAVGVVTQSTQADYLVRMQLVNLFSGVPISIWYDWKDDGSNPLDNEHNYGLVTFASSAIVKPSYTAMKTLTTELAGYEFQYRIPMSNAQDYAFLFKNAAGQYRMAMWTTDIYHLVSPSPAGTPFTPSSSVSISGNRTGLAPILGMPTMTLLTSSPQYIE